MKEIVTCGLIAVAAIFGGILAGATTQNGITEKKLGAAICKKLNGTFARLDGDPICVNAAGDILKFYE